MFQLSFIKDTVAIHPSSFGTPVEQALIAELNKKYANRVLHDVGLCVCVFDISEAGEGKVRYGDGMLWYKVVFRLVVFRPFASEVILAKVKSSDEDGIRVSVGFFDDIYIPVMYLPQPSAFDPNERAHFWLPPDPDEPDAPPPTAHSLLDSPVSSRMYIDKGEVIRVRVEADDFFDDEPGPPKATEGVQAVRQRARPPYTVTCSIAEQGLGPVVWWNAAEAEAMDEG
ncbi:hypothetical protein PUNSTDRAFT_106452 [Punctularia strigosozonata HHB-11173 SS5]|uniref:uncharacterized protein n=1 Tax=Punctularia strigosozonata (strain HHB-11173) TaxID=741275 RepID=UPI0004417D27|nr:uncharacterized protein PUNSTDRAFT_106452 [Punctularia strigosozonata HHB-11173 SS5]EIN06234.1 hypothetical protein PUNSTDRAFT_106452 [Punctularia strigosozonata HHB-11173 SS5]